jgi:hypothetical protein
VESLTLACPLLRHINIRFNQVTSIDEILLHPSIESILATGNLVSKISRDSLLRTKAVTLEHEWRALCDMSLMDKIGGIAF